MGISSRLFDGRDTNPDSRIRSKLAKQFEKEKDRLQTWIGEHTNRIEHIGSTSVPGLSAKPIIDITAVVTNIEDIWGELDKLKVGFGYEISHIPEDWLLLQRTDGDQTYNLHLINESNEQWEQDLLFREYLRANPDIRNRYEEVKREAAEKNPESIDGYNAAKSDFCSEILEEAKNDNSISIPEN